jgi:hypothetical protein
MNGSTGLGVALTRKLHELISSRAKEHGVGLEAFVHAMLTIGATDSNVVQRSVEVAKYLGNCGATRLDQREL